MSFLNPFRRTLKAIHDGLRDGWENAVTLLGTAYSPTEHHQIVDLPWRSTTELEGLYYADPFAARAVRDLPQAAFRGGWTVLAPPGLDPELAQEQRLRLEERLWDLLWTADRQNKLIEAICWGRRDGRGAVWLGVDDGQPQAQPLRLEQVRRVLFLDVLEADDSSAEAYFDDPLGPDFGEPATWRVTRSGGVSDSQSVHTSRLLLFGSGIPTSRSRRAENDWRSCPVLHSPYKLFRNLDLAMQSLIEFLSTSSQAILKIANLLELLGGDQEDEQLLQTRLRVLEMARAYRIMPISAGNEQGQGAEEFSYAERGALTGVADVVLKIMVHLAGAVGEPQALLFGSPPSGLTTEDTGSTRGWYDLVRAEQEGCYRHGLETIIYLLALAEQLDQPEQWGMAWPSLWQESPAEKAARQKAVADTDTAYTAAMVLDPDEVAEARYGTGEWNDRAPQVDLETRAALREQNRARARGEYGEEAVVEQVQPAGVEPAEAVDPSTALNGAQVSALVEIVKSVALGEIPRETGVEIIDASFPVSRAEAEKMMGSVGWGFQSTVGAEEPVPTGDASSGWLLNYLAAESLSLDFDDSTPADRVLQVEDLRKAYKRNLTSGEVVWLVHRPVRLDGTLQFRLDPDINAMPGKERRGRLMPQSVTFPEDWTEERCKSWLRRHGYRTAVEREMEGMRWRARQFNPEHFVKGSFRNRELPNGVQLVLGKVK